MDLSFARFGLDGVAIDMPGDLAVLMAGVAVRQASSPTAMIEAKGPMPLQVHGLLCPPDGAFNRAVAATIRAWNEQ